MSRRHHLSENCGWSYDGAGVWPHPLIDEMEDWDIAPVRPTIHSRDYGFQGETAQDFADRRLDAARAQALIIEQERNAFLKQRRQQIFDVKEIEEAALQQMRRREEEGKPGKYEIVVNKNAWAYHLQFRITEEGKVTGARTGLTSLDPP